MRKVLILLLFMLSHYKGHAQLNVELLHQLVNHSKEENDRQNIARNRQAQTSANEEVNRSKMDELKDKYRILQSRFHSIGLAIDATQIGLQAAPIIREIVDHQTTIFNLATQDPLLLVMAYQTQADLVDNAYRLSQFLYALALSIGDINRMKSSDRKILFEHVLTELRRMASTSRGLAANMYYSNRKRMLESINPFSEYLNKDKQLLESILSKIKQF
ncbi:hypothetical protein [Sphingobacterium bovistauri]|uniref:Plasmid transfer protein n=1 Tax=Sphingobacterium bovistauri TaxID=2781959 RepID=A0ABS7Z9B3_9SPHI|nr:hypothetical protein [Sphingobacterium bovistauri]MCA5006147.1 hypothetical protein [Sphingobacterium bovistauri]